MVAVYNVSTTGFKELKISIYFNSVTDMIISTMHLRLSTKSLQRLSHEYAYMDNIIDLTFLPQF